MQSEHTSLPVGSASLPRRAFISIAAAGCLPAMLPAARAEAGERTLPPLQLDPSLEGQVEACISQLKCLLAAMHPEATDIHGGYSSREDGTFRCSIFGSRDFLEWSGPGLYQVSVDGCVLLYWLDRTLVRSEMTGLVVNEYFLGDLLHDGEFIEFGRYFGKPSIVHKIEGFVRSWGGDVA